MIHKVVQCLILFLLFFHSLPLEAAESSGQKSKMPDNLPITGKSVPGMEDFDLRICNFMKQWQLPGGAVAIMHKGQLTYSRGYGYANFAERKVVQPDSLFRMASLAKLITAVATLKLIDEGKLDFSTNVCSILNYPPDPRRVRSPDSRLRAIIIRHCLENSAGWDRSHNGDPMFVPLVQEAASEYSNSLRPTPAAIIRYQFSRPLDFSPGTRYSYSNFEYSILGEIIARVSGMNYADYVKEKILTPMGISNMVPGKTRDLYANEVRYYGFPGENMGPSILPNIREMLPLEYGGDFYLEAMTADCGWVGSAADMARFVSCAFGDCGAKFQPISDKLLKRMIARPELKEWEGLPDYFAMGCEIKRAGSKDMVVKKDGSLPGSAAIAYHKLDGTTVVIAFNSRPQLALECQERLFDLIEQGLAANKGWQAEKKYTVDVKK